MSGEGLVAGTLTAAQWASLDALAGEAFGISFARWRAMGG